MEQAVIASAQNGVYIDTNGRQLRRIGNLTIYPGDVVWTDRKCIYGFVRGSNDLPNTNTGQTQFPGVPLNTQYGLLIYTKKHNIYKYTAKKGSDHAFVNNTNFYALNSGNPFFDLDIDSKGKPWEIFVQGSYQASATLKDAGSSYYSSIIDYACYWGHHRLSSETVYCSTYIYHHTSEAHPERNEDTITQWNEVGGPEIEEVIYELADDFKVYSEGYILIYNAGKVVDRISLEKYANMAKDDLFSVAAPYSGESVYNDFVNNLTKCGNEHHL